MDGFGNALPFSPISHEMCEVKFSAGSDATYTATPLRLVWQENYRSAAIALVYGAEERAKRLARVGLDMEDAYLSRWGAESRLRRAAAEDSLMGG
ncbi:hypothetical protein ACPPVT_07380 [Angustibacter sp. McL0619]|uniref:hypothetical protein n=1 Tax=Angustibacter sp. McL0619 TaxID=3415676 RepID=UPI003CF99312